MRGTVAQTSEDIRTLLHLANRPMKVADIRHCLGCPSPFINLSIARLIMSGAVELEEIGGETYLYTAPVKDLWPGSFSMN